MAHNLCCTLEKGSTILFFLESSRQHFDMETIKWKVDLHSPVGQTQYISNIFYVSVRRFQCIGTHWGVRRRPVPVGWSWSRRTSETRQRPKMDRQKVSLSRVNIHTVMRHHTYALFKRSQIYYVTQEVRVKDDANVMGFSWLIDLTWRRGGYVRKVHFLHDVICLWSLIKEIVLYLNTKFYRVPTMNSQCTVQV